LDQVGQEEFIIRANITLVGGPNEIRCFHAPERTGQTVYLATTCLNSNRAQHFKISEVIPGRWLIQNEYYNNCPTFDDYGKETLSSACNETDSNQLWVKQLA